MGGGVATSRLPWYALGVVETSHTALSHTLSDMKFELPGPLKQDLIVYDNVLKHTAPVEERRGLVKAVGKPPALFPEGILTLEQFNQAVDHINTSYAEDRIYTFQKDEDSPYYAILHHHNGVWTAAWTMPEGSDTEYLYGYTTCVRNNKAGIKKAEHLHTLNSYTTHTVGRSSYLVRSEIVTLDNILDVERYHGFLGLLEGWDRGKEVKIAKAVRLFYKNALAVIPSWSRYDNREIYNYDEFSTRFLARYESIRKPIYFISTELKINRNSVSDYISEHKINPYDWKLTADNFIHFIESAENMSFNENKDLLGYSNIIHILTTPFFKRTIASILSKLPSLVLSDLTDKREAQNLLKKIRYLVDNISFIYSIWPSVSIDHFQTNLDSLTSISCIPHFIDEEVNVWLKDNMPVESFFNCLRKFASENEHGLIFTNWKDTYQMIRRILSSDIKIELTPPKRWRMAEFHDHVQAIAWKAATKLVKLPQDLFPKPVKVSLGDTSVTFFQPIDTHQLAEWGQAVRNCVGASSHYADAVKKKLEFIVLAMVDSKPTFTVQLRMSNGYLEVVQIAGYANSYLTQDQYTLYTEAFGQALREVAGE